MKRVARAPLVFIDFYGLTPPYTVVNQGGSWLDFVEGTKSFKIVVVVSKNSTEVGRNRPWKMGGRRRSNGGFSGLIGPLKLANFWHIDFGNLLLIVSPHI
ncbi:hypothetical protein ACFX1Q_027712 [Malus domestica]